MKYTREDVIVTREQAEKVGLKKGDRVFCADIPHSCVDNANSHGFSICKIEDINWSLEHPFCTTNGDWDCIIKQKEPKYVPFDFSLKEDRDALIGKRIECEEAHLDGLITGFRMDSHNILRCDVGSSRSYTGEGLLCDCIFADTDKPVGKEIEE